MSVEVNHPPFLLLLLLSWLKEFCLFSVSRLICVYTRPVTTCLLLHIRLQTVAVKAGGLLASSRSSGAEPACRDSSEISQGKGISLCFSFSPGIITIRYGGTSYRSGVLLEHRDAFCPGTTASSKCCKAESDRGDQQPQQQP